MEEYRSVVVVGAGITGLYAARLLKATYPDVLVVEAQDRIGGRVKHAEGFAAWPVQLGPEFIHGADSLLTEVMDDLGFVTNEKPWPDWWYLGREGQLLGPSDHDDELEKLHELMGHVGDEVLPGPSQDMSAEEWLRQQGATEKMLEVADVCYANDFGCSLRQLGLKEMIEENRRWDSGETYLLPDCSMEELPRRLATGLEVRLSWPVTRVQYSRAGSCLDGPGGKTIHCRKVLVTVALPILQQGVIDFRPPFPVAKQQALQRVRMGNVVKILLSFSKRFWPENLYDVVCTHSFVPELWMTTYTPTDRANKDLHCCVGFAAGQRADALSRLPPSEAIQCFVRQLNGMFSTPDNPNPATSSFVKGDVFDWSKEQWVRGAYTYPSLGAELGDRDAIAAPVEGTVFFAGEATSPAMNPCMQAGMESARRAAWLMRDLGSLAKL